MTLVFVSDDLQMILKNNLINFGLSRHSQNQARGYHERQSCIHSVTIPVFRY